VDLGTAAAEGCAAELRGAVTGRSIALSNLPCAVSSEFIDKPTRRIVASLTLTCTESSKATMGEVV
jgi:hypothetical protein